jgi:two-component system sensor histidine kinase AlgZ
VCIGLSNPYHPEHQHRQGNRMALANIRERLLLHFDVEARLDTVIDGERFRIDMILPYRRAM